MAGSLGATTVTQATGEAQLSELQRLATTAETSAGEARASASTSAKLAAVATIAAVLALGASLASYRLAFSDDESDRQWRRDQRAWHAEKLRVLTEIRDEFERQSQSSVQGPK